MTRFQPPTRDYSAYLFDCDGTLVESMPVHHQAWRTALQAHGAPFEFDWALFLSRAGMTHEETVRELNAQFGARLDPSLVAASQHDAYRQLVDGVLAIDEVARFARSLAGKAKMAVASGGQRSEVERCLRQTRLISLFECILTANDVTHGKPHPEIFLRCAELLNVPPEECLVIEDGELGIRAAEAAGMAWIRVAAFTPA